MKRKALTRKKVTSRAASIDFDESCESDYIESYSRTTNSDDISRRKRKSLRAWREQEANQYDEYGWKIVSNNIYERY